MTLEHLIGAEAAEKVRLAVQEGRISLGDVGGIRVASVCKCMKKFGPVYTDGRPGRVPNVEQPWAK